MIHQDTHDPVTDWQRCLTCSQALSAAWASVADIPLGPDNPDRLIRLIRREAERHLAHGAAS